ncbi:conserved hypothetical protein [Leishmania major strain Friedlin]|uniref:Uncharacterized protein n=1 Tax=Leishmania major TaxID=5664 RepID=E9AFT0_LEIMA|nr:conserved hypothetical protein [Leishmania major strain Friedlin]CAG9582811.1 hypothetical_protein_-_conserved [Leishmania major strain Friedlin]CBZ13084.1 conserved hypothetical protein [Leishmania major strain Friedlin]|eukprot:XP_003722850.1 conserved hypothetical protein [Leishmania major strain Friedlin]
MTTLKDSSISAATIGGVAGQTMLPSTCGEETDLPGVPRVGCVAVISYKPRSLHGFSACVVGMADGIAILGPDLTQRRYGRHRLLTRLLWRPVSSLEGGGGRSNATAREGESAAVSRSGTAILPHTKGSCASIVAVTACLVAGEDGNYAHAAQETAEDDTIAIVVAWSDATLRHHITVLMAQLRCILAPSSAGSVGSSGRHVEAGLVHVVAHDALPLCPMQFVLRLFYHPAMAASENKTAQNHVVMCSVYSPLGSTTLSAGHFGQSDAGASTNSGPANTVVKQSHPTVGTAAAAAELGGTSAVASARRRGELLFLTVSPCHTRGAAEATAAVSPCVGSACANCCIQVRAEPSTGKEVAAWLLQFQPDRVICAFAVQSTTTSVIAAAGATDGRVYLLGLTSQRLVLRVSGPVADVMFVQTKRENDRSQTRNAVVDGLLDDAMAEDTLRNGSFSSQADEFARHEGVDFAALVILDSAGHLLVLRAINSGAAITQNVADIPQVITLANGQQPTFTAVNLSLASLDGEPISSKHFHDLCTLRHFFSQRRLPLSQLQRQQQQRKPGRSNPSPASPPLASSSLSTSPVNRSFSNGAAGAEETTIAGHILSRGLLCVTCVYNAKGGAELVVSTMGQVVVSVPFSSTDGCFRIAGFTITPSPMFYVGFVDFFADGNPTLVMAGLKNVLVASRPQPTIRERVQLLLRLLGKKEREQQNAESGRADG